MKIKEIDNYTYSVILALAGTISILGYEKSKAFIYITGLLLLIAFLLSVYTHKRGTGSIVANDYEGEAYTKIEDSKCLPEKLQPKQTRKGIDGIITNYDKKRVFKVSNGIKRKSTSKAK